MPRISVVKCRKDGGCLRHVQPFNPHLIMASYSIETYTLNYTADLTALKVKSKNNQTTIATYDLSSAIQLSYASGSYHIVPSDELAGHHLQLNVSNNDSAYVTTADHLGVTDLRTDCRAVFAYHLGFCPIQIQYADGKLHIYSPCTGGCTSPSADCCTITPLN